MDYLNLVFQLFSAGILVYLILRLFDLELRVDTLESKKNITISLSPPQAPPPPQENEAPLIVVSGGGGSDYHQEEQEGGEEEAHPDLIQTEEVIDDRLLIEPQQLDTTEEASARLRKLTVAELTDIASEKKIPLVVGKKKLTKDALIKAIMSGGGDNK